MSNQRVIPVIDALISLTTALPGYRLPSGRGMSVGATTVYDGPEWTASDDGSDGAQLVIGWSGSGPSELEVAADSTWVSGPIAGSVHPRDEVTTVACMAFGQRAERSRDARVVAYQVMSDVAQVCRADPSLGINTTNDAIGGMRTLCFVTAGQLVQYSSNGYVAQLGFTVTYSARV
jgi:hypothetical protein